MSTSAVVASPAPVDARQRAARRLVWSLVLFFVALGVAVPGGIYLAWMIKGRAALRQELQFIATAGEPVTTSEMNAWYKVPAGQRDITPIWTAALRGSAGFARTLATLNDVTNYELPPLGQALTDQAGMQQLLQTHQPVVDALHAAAAEEGVVRYPHDFSDGLMIMMPEVDEMGSAEAALSLEFQVLARAGDTPGVIRNLRTRYRMAETLSSEPILVALLVRQRFHKLMMRDMLQYVIAQPNLTEGDLQTMVELVRSIDYQDQIGAVLIGERALCYVACHYRFSTIAQLDAMHAKRPTIHTGDPGAVPRPEDCATTIRLLTDLRQASKLPMATFLAAIAKTRNEIETLKDAGHVQRWRYHQTIVILPTICDRLHGHCKAHVYRDLVDIALNLERYRLQHGQLPEDMNQLCPTYMASLPIDLYDGLPMKTSRTERMLTLYSVGSDQVDNGGDSKFPTLEPDVAVTIPLAR